MTNWHNAEARFLHDIFHFESLVVSSFLAVPGGVGPPISPGPVIPTNNTGPGLCMSTVTYCISEFSLGKF